MLIRTLGLVGVGALGLKWQAVQQWLFSDWTHAAVAGLGVLSVGSVLALYGAEKEFEDFRGIVARISEVKAGLWKGYNNQDEKGVLRIRIAVEFSNHLDLDVTVRPIQLSISHKRKWRWRTLTCSVRSKMGISPIGEMARHSYFAEGQHTVPKRDENAGFFWFEADSPPETVLEDPLRLNLKLSIPGQPSARLVAPLILNEEASRL